MSDFLPVVALTPSITQSSPTEASLLGHARGLEDSSNPDRMRRSAQEFESILLSQWLEQAREAFAGVPGGEEEDSDDPGHDQMWSLGSQSLATAVTKSGGVGIAKLLVGYLEKQHGASNQAISKK
jgi:Rod binding domain-containing protein